MIYYTSDNFHLIENYHKIGYTYRIIRFYTLNIICNLIIYV